MSLFSKIEKNSRIVLKNSAMAFLVKGGALCVSLMTTPAFIQYFQNNTVLGVWYTLLSVLMWFLNFDLGIGNGIRNNLVKDLTRQDLDSARRTLSSGLFSIGLVSVGLMIVGTVLVRLVDLNWLYNIEAEVVSYDALTMATLVVLAGIMLRFFLTSISSVFYALQMSSVNNLLALCVSILQLVFVKTVTPAAPEQGLVMLACAYAVLSNLPILVAGVIVFSTKLRRCVPGIRYIDKQHIQNVMGIGAVFFACQIFYMLIANTNEFLISNLFGPQYTTEYSFYHKLTSLISMAASLALTPIWSVVTKAMTEKNYAWLDRLYRKLKLAGILVIVAQFAFILIQQPVMDIWLREDSITVELPTALAFAFFGSAFVYSSILSTVVCGMARMKLQMICYFIGAILKFAMVYLLGPVFNDWTIVVWANGLILLPYCIAQQIDLNRTIKKMALTPLETPPEDGQAPEPQA